MKLLSGFIFIALLLWTSFAFTPAARASEFEFENISIGQGISQSDITAMLQDSTGFMWFATNNGLNRYDGYAFRTFKADSRDSTTLSNSIIFSMTDHGGRYLWVGTKGGMDRYDAFGDNFKHYLHAEDIYGNRASLNHVTSLCVTRDGMLWGVMRGYVIYFDAKADMFRMYTVSNSMTGAKLKVFNNICEYGQERMLVAANRGVYALNRKTMESSLFFNPELIAGGRNSRILSLFPDPSDGLLYIGGEDGVYVTDAAGKLIREILHAGTPIQKASTMIRDSHGRLWIGTREKGIYIETPEGVVNCTYDPRNDKTIGSNYVLSLYEDASGVVWVGTSSGGVSKMPLSRKPFRNYNHNPHTGNSLSDDVIFAVYADGSGIVWVATKDGVLNRLDSKTGAVTRYRPPQPRNTGTQIENLKIYGILSRNDRELWLATGHGIHSFDKTTGVFDQSPVRGLPEGIRMRTMMHDNRGRLWVLSRQSGVYIVEDGRLTANYTMKNLELSDDFVRGICQDRHGEIWIGTRSGGVNRLTGYDEGYEVRVIRNIPGDTASLSLDNITAIYEDSRGRLWIGTWGGGLNLVTDRDRMKVKVYNEYDGLSDNVIFGIFEDGEGKLWINTYNGLSCFDPDLERFRNYTAADGLPSNEFIIGAISRTPDGEIVLGTINGLTIFRPEEITAVNTTPTQLAVTRLLLDNQEIRPGSVHGKRKILDRAIYLTNHITLPYGKRSVGFELASFSFGAPSLNKFAYRLDGVDGGWNYPGTNRLVTYSNLRPGKYVFRFNATNSDGVWCDEPYELGITVLSPFWATNAAYVFYAAFLSGIVVLAVTHFSRRQEKKNKTLQAVMKLENEQALHEAKIKFYTNISHELRTPLALIHGLIERVDDKLGPENPVSSQLTVMRRNADRLLNLVNDLLDLRRIETGNRKLKPQTRDVVPFVRAIWSYFESEAESRGISFFFNARVEGYEATLDYEKTEKIIYNLLSNAMKFTNTFVEMGIRTDFRDGRELLFISVRDDGPGISEEEHEKIFYRFYQSEMNDSQHTGSGLGLNLAMELAKLQGGELSVSSTLGGGASFCLRLPSDITESAVREGMAPDSWENVHDSSETRNAPPCPSASSTVSGVVSGATSDATSSAASNVTSGAASNRRPLILVVDDNSDMRYYLKQTLGNDYRIAEAGDGASAIEMAVKLLPDLVLCDVMMSGMDGIAVCARLKEDSRTSKIPVVLATAKVSDESRVEGLKSGADAYITKPFTEQHLKAQIHNILNSRDSIRTAISREIISTPRREEAVSAQDKLLVKAVALIEKNIFDPDYDVSRLSAELHISRVHFYRQMKTMTGQSPSDFIRDFRLAKAAGLLEQNKLDVSEVTYMVGFNSPKYFSACFKKKYGVIPVEYASRFASGSLPQDDTV